ncbi:MAG: ABC transporter permease [Candidatus Tectomicrobia bacterium]|uniref:ABC transporter permease n=1 Tax=Tectimicrobiota bacterium TaxID=2528274 RepID=A0A932ML86_UNCTE|nr:ABC transporter permease [Candidatus Tectomicrobia bacterium]
MDRASATLPQFILRRALHAVPLLFAVVVVNFTIIHLAPGDPINVLVGDFPAPPEYVARLKVDFGLDRPLWEQLFIYMGRLFRGDLGFSFANRQPVLGLILERLPATLLLSGTALVLAAILGVALGVLASRRPYSWLDNLTSVISLAGFSMPVFWLGQLLILGFALELRWLPAQGMVSLRAEPGGWGRALSVAVHLILPALALGARFLALNSRIARASMLEVLRREYIVTARAKGVSERRIVYLHALRNSLIPIVTAIGFNFGFLLAGSALVETVFAWPGIGRLLYDSITSRDYPVIMGIFLVVCAGIVVVNLLTDIAYAYLDPRVRL